MHAVIVPAVVVAGVLSDSMRLVRFEVELLVLVGVVATGVAGSGVGGSAVGCGAYVGC